MRLHGAFESCLLNGIWLNGAHGHCNRKNLSCVRILLVHSIHLLECMRLFCFFYLYILCVHALWFAKIIHFLLTFYGLRLSRYMAHFIWIFLPFHFHFEFCTQHSVQLYAVIIIYKWQRKPTSMNMRRQMCVFFICFHCIKYGKWFNLLKKKFRMIREQWKIQCQLWMSIVWILYLQQEQIILTIRT